MAEGRSTPLRHGKQKAGGENDRTAPKPDLAARLTDAASDPGEVRKALDDAASMSCNLWLAFLTFGTYLLIAVGSVTHKDLFLEKPIRLPLLDVELPLVAFFAVAPLLFVIFHAYLLLNLKLMADNAERYNQVVELGETLWKKRG